MREDYQEQLERMFPNGYVIFHVQNNDNIGYSWFNPNNDEFLVEYLKMVNEVFVDEIEEE